MARAYQKPDRQGGCKRLMSRQMTTSQARDEIMQSIRAHLAASPRIEPAHVPIITDNATAPDSNYESSASLSRIEMFCERLESVGGHCVIVRDEDEASRALNSLISELQERDGLRRIALSDAALVSRLTRDITAEQLEVCPQVSDL